MSFKAMRFALVGCMLLAASSVVAAPMVSFQYSPGLVRTQVQGGGTYDAIDVFYTATPGADFTNYRIQAVTTTGNLADPARLQDDRQTSPPSGLADGNTLGAVDLFASTVMAAAAKDDGGFGSSYVFTAYSPAGTGAAPLFTALDWEVFDSVDFDDNDLSNFPADQGGPFASAAPYHIARVLATPGSIGNVSIEAYDSQSQGVFTPFSFAFGEPPLGVAPDVGDLNEGDVDRNAITGLGPLPILNTPDPAAIVWTLTSFTGSGEPADAPAIVDPVTGEFSWNTNQNTSLGPYSAVIRATNTTGFDEATLSFNVVVPEPASIALLGLAMVGGLGLVRRRDG